MVVNKKAKDILCQMNARKGHGFTWNIDFNSRILVHTIKQHEVKYAVEQQHTYSDLSSSSGVNVLGRKSDILLFDKSLERTIIPSQYQ